MIQKMSVIIFLALACPCLQASERAVVRISSPTPDLAASFSANGYDIAACRPGEWLDLVVPVGVIDTLRQIHPNLRVTQTEAQIKANLVSGQRDLDGYHSYQGLLSELNSLASQHPDIMTLIPLGVGWGGQYYQSGFNNYQNYNHQIMAVKVSDNPSVEEDEPALFFVGAHHAREPLSVETTLAVLQDVAQNYNTDPVITNAVNNAVLWFVPLLNPDGHKVVWDQQDVWWRKNIRDNNNNQAFNTYNQWGYGPDGVDLNRNYDFEWGYFSSTDNILSATYHGLQGFSEPETQILRDLLMSHPFVAGISFHTYSELVLYPFGYMANATAPDEQELAGLAYDMAALIPSEGNGYYTPEPSWLLYPASGSLDDWAYGERGIFSYTIELSTEFIPNASTVSLVCQRIKPAARKMMERITKSMLTGQVTDSVTRQPLEAIIYVEGIDDSPIYRSPYKSTLPFGRYYRLLPDGETFNVKIYAPGYLPFEAPAQTSETGITVLDAMLQPSPIVNLSVLINTFGEIPVEGALLEFPEANYPPMISDASGIINISGFALGHYRIRISKPGYETIDIQADIVSQQLTILFSDIPYVNQDFETSLSAWTDLGAWGITTSQFYGGTKSLADSPAGNYQNNVNSHIRLANPLSLNNVANTCLSFFLKLEMTLDGDYCTLEYSTDNQNWNAIDYYYGESGWSRKTYNLNSLSGQQVWLRFHFVSNEDGTDDGIFIDDFMVYGSGEVHANHYAADSPLSVLSAHPNPFRGETRIALNLTTEKAAQAQIGIYNTKGQLVALPLNKSLTSGSFVAVWDGMDSRGQPVSEGIYFIALSLDGCRVNTRKTLLLR